MTIKFLKQWGIVDFESIWRELTQTALDGGQEIVRKRDEFNTVEIALSNGTTARFTRRAPADAVKFAAALNKLRRPLHLIKKDLDEDWARRVKERDNQTCLLCGIQGPKSKTPIKLNIQADMADAPDCEEDEDIFAPKTPAAKKGGKQDVLTAHHWLKTKARAGMARWDRACGVTVHFAEHIHLLHENPCWADLEPIYRHIAMVEGEEAIQAALRLSKVRPEEKLVRALWLQNVGNRKD